MWKSHQVGCSNNNNITFQPKVVSDQDEVELAKQLQQLEDENREVSGDEDEDEDEFGDKHDSGDEDVADEDVE